MMQFLSNIPGNDWLNFAGAIIGALLGGLISGVIAYIVAKTQINQMKNESKSDEINKFFKVYHVLSPLLERVLILLNDYREKPESYPLDLPKKTLINHMLNHLDSEHNAKHSKNKDDMEMGYHHLKQIINIRDELKDIYETVLNLRDEYIPYEYYKTYQDILRTLKSTISFADKFLFHDDDIPKDEFQLMLNSYHESHSNNDVIQHRLVKHKNYSQFVMDIHQYKKELEELFEEKSQVLKKLEK